jgi:hypothetical protein
MGAPPTGAAGAAGPGPVAGGIDDGVGVDWRDGMGGIPDAGPGVLGRIIPG